MDVLAREALESNLIATFNHIHTPMPHWSPRSAELNMNLGEWAPSAHDPDNMHTEVWGMARWSTSSWWRAP